MRSLAQAQARAMSRLTKHERALSRAIIRFAAVGTRDVGKLVGLYNAQRKPIAGKV